MQNGAASVADVKMNLIAISGGDIVKGRHSNDAVFAQLDARDAIIFGSPTDMGGPAAPFKASADATGVKWHAGARRERLAAGFTASSGPSGDKSSTLHYFLTLAMQLGMSWIGLPELPMNDQGSNPLSRGSGVMAQARPEAPDVAPDAPDKLTGERPGARGAG